MANKEVKGLVFGGIERVNERINCNVGACEEIINLRREGNAWKNVHKKEQLTKNGLNINDTQGNVFIHPVSKEYYYIVYDKNNIVLYDKQTEKENLLNKFLVSGEIVSVSYLDDVLIVCTTQDKYFFLYDKITKSYTKIDISKVRANISAKGHPMFENKSTASKGTKGVATNIGGKQYENNSLKKTFFVYSYDKANKLYPVIKRGAEVDISQSNGANSFTEAVGDSLAYQPYQPDYDNIKEVTKATIGFLKEVLKNDETKLYDNKQGDNATHKDTFYGFSFYRAAFKMYDGNYLNYSNISFADANGDDIETQGSMLNKFPVTIEAKPSSAKLWTDKYYTDYVAIYNMLGVHSVKIDLSKNFTTIKQLMEKGIITSVDLFATKPVFSVNLDKDPLVSFNQGDHKGETLSQTNNYKYKYGFVIKANYERNVEEFEKQLNSGIYYKIYSLNKKDIKASTSGVFEKIIKSEDVETIETNKTLPTPTTDNIVLAKNAYNYNRQQHLYNIIYKMFEGYDYALDEGDNSNTTFNSLVYAMGDTTTNVKGLYYVVKGKYNREQFCVKHKINNPDKYITETSGVYELRLPRLFSYPNIEDTTFEIIILYNDNKYKTLFSKKLEDVFEAGNTTFVINLKNSNTKYFTAGVNEINVIFNNGNFNNTVWFYVDEYDNKTEPDSHLEMIKENIDTSTQTSQTTFNEINSVESTNVLQLSAADNPFVLPNSENYSFGESDNEIIAIGQTGGFVSERNFGNFPLYVFCSNGVYVLSVGGGENLYSNVLPLNNDKVINNNILCTPQGIVFITNQGVSILNNNSKAVLSDLIKGSPTITNERNLNQVVSSVNRKFYTPITDDFLEEIKDCQTYFDDKNNEACFVVGKKYTYVYSFNYKVWYKRTDAYKVENSQLLSKIDVQGTLVRPKYLLKLYSIKETQEEFGNITIITKPVLLDTRQYKHIERIIFDMSWTNNDEFYISILASNNGVDYTLLKKVMQTKSDMEAYKQDYYLSRALRSCKYVVCWIDSKQWNDANIVNGIIEFKQVRNIKGIR